MKNNNEILKIFIVIGIVLLIILIVIKGLISTAEKNKHEEVIGGGIGFTNGYDKKANIEYKGDKVLEKSIDPIEVSRFIKSIENFIINDVQEMLDNDKRDTDNLVEHNTNYYAYGAFIISKESLNNLLEELQSYKYNDLGTTIKTCEFSYNDNTKQIEIIFELNDGKKIEGLLTKEEEFFVISF